MIEYKIAQESDYLSINNFYNRLHGSKRTIEQFRWEFHDGPLKPGIYIIAVDSDNNAVVGSQAAMYMNVVLSHGEKILTAKSEDTLVDPTYRGKNIFNNMYEMLFDECKKNGIEYIWGFTTAIKPFKGMNFEVPWSHSQTLAVSNPIAAYKYLVKLNSKNKLKDKFKIFGLAAKSYLKLKSSFLFAVPKLKGFQEDIPVADASLIIGNILKTSQSPYFAIDQDANYQRWRFYANSNYKTVKTYSLIIENQLKAFLIIHISDENIGYIVQALFDPSLGEKVIEKFIQQSTAKIFRLGVSIIRNWSFTHTEYNNKENQHFIKVGYTFLDRGVPFVWKSLNNGPLDPSNLISFKILSEGTN